MTENADTASSIATMPRIRCSCGSSNPGTPAAFALRQCNRARVLRRFLALHRLEELAVRLGVAHLVDQELGSRQLVHRVQELAQDPDLLQLLRRGDQLLAARAGPV